MSWIIVCRATGQPVVELFERRNVARVDTTRYEILTAHEWLVRVNQALRKQEKNISI